MPVSPGSSVITVSVSRCFLTVRMRIRAAVDADVDQHGPVPVHRGPSVQVAADAWPGRRAHRAHVADRADGVHAGTVLVPRAAGQGRQHIRVHDRVPQERLLSAVHRVHAVRGVAVVHTAHDAVRVSLPADIPQAEQDPPADRALRHAPVQSQPVVAHPRFHATGAYIPLFHASSQA